MLPIASPVRWALLGSDCAVSAGQLHARGTRTPAAGLQAPCPPLAFLSRSLSGLGHNGLGQLGLGGGVLDREARLALS